MIYLQIIIYKLPLVLNGRKGRNLFRDKKGKQEIVFQQKMRTFAVYRNKDIGYLFFQDSINYSAPFTFSNEDIEQVLKGVTTA